MALRWNNPSGIRQVLQSIFLLLIPLSAHGEPSLATASRQTFQHNQSVSAVVREGFSGRMVLSDDSAERDHLIGAGLGLGAGLPLSSHQPSHRQARLDSPEEEPISEELTAGGGGPDQPTHPSSDDIITVEFHSPAPDTSVSSDLSPDWMRPAKPLEQKGGDPTAWTLSDFYDYLSPDDDLSALDTTPDPEPSPSPLADVEDENPLLVGSSVVPDTTPPSGDAQPVPPSPAVVGRRGPGLGGGEGSDGCSLGFVKSDAGACVSQCDSQPDFCFNGGMCTVVAGIGAFCRCNVQEYIWNKGSRCDWMITEFQVVCLVVGVASLMLLLLFMIIVFFAKRLHLLKRENKTLRKRSGKHRSQSEPQTDGFSVSTVTDGSHPNKPVGRFTWEYKPRCPYYQDDPQKLEDPVKSAPPKEEENLNIRNSHSPKHENNRPTSVADYGHGHAPNNTEEMAEDGVTIGLELLLPPNDATLRPDASPQLHYNVFLYKLPNNGDPTQNARPASTRPSPSPSPSPSPNHAAPRPQPSPGRHPSPNRHPSPGRHQSSPHRHATSPPSPQASPHRHATSPSSPQASPHGHATSPSSPQASPQLRRPRGRSGTPFSHETPPSQAFLRPSPSSPHLAQPASPSRAKYSPVSTRSLPYAL